MRNILVTITLSLTLVACATTPKGKFDYEKSTDFVKFRTYHWVTEEPILTSNTSISIFNSPPTQQKYEIQSIAN